jgi:hypothetical protein
LRPEKNFLTGASASRNDQPLWLCAERIRDGNNSHHSGRGDSAGQNARERWVTDASIGSNFVKVNAATISQSGDSLAKL